MEAPVITRPRRRPWVVVTAIASGFVLFVGVFTFALFAVIIGSFDHSEIVVQALGKARKSQVLLDRLGSPIDKGKFMSGSINESGPDGNADLDIPLHGPKGSGELFVVASKSAGTWSFETLEFQADGSTERVNLLKSESPASIK